MDVPHQARWQIPEPLRKIGTASWLTLGAATLGVGVLLLLAVARTITIPLILGIMFGIAAFPLTDWFERRLHRRSLAALVVTALAVVLSAVVAFIVVDQLIGQAATIGQNLETAAQDLKTSVGSDSGAADVVGQLETSVKDNWQTLLRGALALAGGAVSSLAALFLAIFLSFNIFFLVQKDGRKLKRWAARHLLLPPPLATSILSDAVHAVRGYFVGTSIVALQNAGVIFIAALALGTPIPFVIAVVVFLFAFVPFIGAIVSGTFAVIMAYAGGGTTDALIMLVVVFIANGVLQTVVQQIALGSTLNLNPLAVLVATITGSIIAGPIGGVISAPLTATAVMAVGRIRASDLFAPSGEQPTQDVLPNTG
ncbi:MAG: AI-2E family transporter [Actinobacteria bacterium]|nr:AI-2E family transporter [Actinomycetota bacterium]